EAQPQLARVDPDNLVREDGATDMGADISDAWNSPQFVRDLGHDAVHLRPGGAWGSVPVDEQAWIPERRQWRLSDTRHEHRAEYDDDGDGRGGDHDERRTRPIEH